MENFIRTIIEPFKALLSYAQNPEYWLQLALIIVAMGIGSMIRKPLIKKLSHVFEKTEWHLRIEKILMNVGRLVMPLVSIFFLTVAKQAANEKLLPVGTDLLGIAISLLSAWVLIRVLVQFIDNNFLRSTVAMTGWIIAALSILGILDDTTSALDAFGITMGEFRLSALTVVKGGMALFILLYIATFLSSIMEKQIDKITGLTASSRVLLSKVIRIVLVTFALLIGITTAGIDMSLLAVFSGAVGLGIGFGLQKGVSNLFSGMLLLLDKSIKPGDIIELEGTFGWVEHMGARYTSIVTRDNKAFLVPNEDFITQRVVNWSHGDTLVRVEVQFGVSYDHNPHEINAMAQQAAQGPDRICKDPAPVCHFIEFGESSMNFKLRFWIKDAEKGVTNMRGAVMLALWDTFKENGINIPYPHRQVIIQNSVLSNEPQK